MGIYIKGVDMPLACAPCPVKYWCGLWSKVTLPAHIRHPDCPLVEVPEHGRLVNADKLEEEIDFSLQQVNAYLDNIDADYYSAEYREMEARAECYRDALEYIRDAPTVIPKEEP